MTTGTQPRPAAPDMRMTHRVALAARSPSGIVLPPDHHRAAPAPFFKRHFIAIAVIAAITAVAVLLAVMALVQYRRGG